MQRGESCKMASPEELMPKTELFPEVKLSDDAAIAVQV
jgi:hypothetical protein